MKKVRYGTKKQRTRSKEKESLVTRVVDSGIGKVVLLTVSILMLLSVYRSFKQMGQKISLLKQAQQEVRELRLENLELSLKIEDAGSLIRLEKEARNRLNYGQEGEIAFVVDDELIEVGKESVEKILYPEEEINEVDVLGEWTDFIVRGY